MAAQIVVVLALARTSAAQPAATSPAASDIPFGVRSQYSLFHGCPDERSSFRAFGAFIDASELRDALPEGAAANKKRLHDPNTTRVLIFAPYIQPQLRAIATRHEESLRAISDVCSHRMVRCALFFHASRSSGAERLPDGIGLSGIPNVPQFIGDTDLLRARGRGVDDTWSAKLDADVVATVFDAQHHLRWVVKLDSAEADAGIFAGLVLSEALRTVDESACDDIKDKSAPKAQGPAPPPAGAEPAKPKPAAPASTSPPNPITRSAPPDQSSTTSRGPTGVRLRDLRGPALSLKSRDNASLAAPWLQELNRVRPILFYVWGTWCGPCEADWPHLQELHDTHGKGVRFLGIAFERDSTPLDDVARYVATTAQRKAPFLRADRTYVVRGLDSGSAELLNRFGSSANAPPFFAIFDRSGMMVFSYRGAIFRREAYAALACALDAVGRESSRVAPALCGCRSQHELVDAAWRVECGGGSQAKPKP
ncbi:MAG TPA: TlpA disulfide reductase family protein [Thermoanaerobaculia bacterium]|nr:TlpA disulfide reductase family protein [Thermoanaerobaculia bacterium]